MVRGWLEGRYEDISLIYAAILGTVGDEWTNILWTVPPKETMGQRYAFLGGTVPQNRMTWFRDQLESLIALLPADSGHHLRGLFITTRAGGGSQWRIVGQQVLIDPAPPEFAYLDDTPLA